MKKWIGIVMLLCATQGYAAPGDILFFDDFDNGGGCRGLAPQWSTTDTNLGATGTQTANSGNCSMFTRGTIVSNTSITVDLSAAIGADFSVWIRAGADSFSEDVDAGEDLVVEYFDNTGTWQTLDQLFGGSPGAVTNISTSLPASALHAGFRLRFRQLGGSGGPPQNGGIGYDYWHIDDVTVTETGTAPPVSSSTLGAGQCDDFESGFGNWQTTNGSRSGINSDTANSPNNALFMRHDTVTTTALAFDSAGAASFDVWVRRGADSFSENPDSGENLVVEYLNSTNNWITLETFGGGGPQGQVFNRSYALPDAGRHANFRVRFRFTQGSGSDFDYWHIDDVCFPAGAPSMVISKTVAVEQDPVNGTTSPFAIPGAWVVYTLTIENNDIGLPDDGSLVITDVLDANTTFFSGDFDGSGSPIRFVDGSGAASSGLSLPFNALGDAADGVEFRNAANVSITPNGDFDETVRSFVITFPGQLAGSSASGDPTFTLEYRARIN